MVILSSISSGLEFWTLNDTSIHEISESKVFNNVTFFGETFSNWPNDLLGTKVYSVILLIIVVKNATMY